MNVPFYNPEAGMNLADVNDTHLYSLAQQGNMGLSHGALIEQATAQQEMRVIASQQNIEVPKVNFYPSRHPDPNKARRRDIRQAYKLLTPAKRRIWNPLRLLFGRKYVYNKQSNVCVIDGCDCAALIQYDNLYAKITDEESGRSLWEMYWQNPVTGEAQAFVAQDKVTSGTKMRGTYCPEHLHLFHLLNKWEVEEERVRDANPRRLRDKVKKGVSIVSVPVASVAKPKSQIPFLEKYEPFFAMLEQDARKTKGINIHHYTNPVTNINDFTTISFDMRVFQEELRLLNQPTPAFQAMLAGENPETQGVLPTE